MDLRSERSVRKRTLLFFPPHTGGSNVGRSRQTIAVRFRLGRRRSEGDRKGVNCGYVPPHTKSAGVCRRGWFSGLGVASNLIDRAQYLRSNRDQQPPEGPAGASAHYHSAPMRRVEVPITVVDNQKCLGKNVNQFRERPPLGVAERRRRLRENCDGLETVGASVRARFGR